MKETSMFLTVLVPGPRNPKQKLDVFLQPLTIATPKPGPTRMASPNRNPGDSRLILFIFRVIKFSFSKVSRPESPA